MPPPLALALTLLLIGYLIRRDGRVAPRPSRAIWIPIVWLLINGSRQASQWLGRGPQFASQALQEGSPVDQVVYGTLIVAGILVLANRRVRIGQLAKNNWWIILFFLYEGISFVWSDFPFVSFKRWIKASGDFVMVFVLLSDPYPVRAIIATIKRSGYVLIPFSLLFCKYYEDMGRVYDDWGHSFYTGVTLDKNMFGYLLFAYGLFFASALVHVFRQNSSSRATKRADLVSYATLLAMVATLTPLANSKTSLLALIIGTGVILALQFSKVKRHFFSLLIATVLIAAIANALFPVQDAVFEAAGRDASFTGRTGIWQRVLNEPNNPLLGTGYASFWLGERLQRIWAWNPRTPLLQAHNGYLEVYLNLGLVGVALLGGVLWTGLRNARRRLIAEQYTIGNLDDSLFSAFGIAYIVAYLFYNITEATFVGLNFLFIIFLLVAFDFPRTEIEFAEEEEDSTNLIESCFSQTEDFSHRVKRWRNGKMFLR
jgi:exopolysaccharide production protein ExoQ